MPFNLQLTIFLPKIHYSVPFKKFQMDNVNGYPLVGLQLMLNGVTVGAEWRKD
jgi:hypothetical protein